MGWDSPFIVFTAHMEGKHKIVRRYEPSGRRCKPGDGVWWYTRLYQKFPDRVDKEINNNKHSLRSNTKCYGGISH
jgi:hypothetical protein